jgi:magnesium chelatase subunit I
VADEVSLIAQEAELVADVPRHLIEVLARFSRQLRESTAIDQRSGVSARFAIAGAEIVAAAALRRSALTGEDAPVARPVDLDAVPDVLRGKLEFESGEEGREIEILEHLLRKATAETARARLGGLDLKPLAEAVAQHPVRTGERVPAAEVVAALPQVPVLTEIARRLDAEGTEAPGRMASAAELALELLFLTRRLAKDSEDGTVSYG